MSKRMMPIALPDARLHGRERQFFNRAPGAGLRVEAKAGETVIDLYDEIGFWGVTAGDMRKTLNAIDAGRITLRINSPGGDVFDGIAIYNDLLAHDAEVAVQVTGLAASAASIVAMAGDTIEMAPSAFMMVHNAWGLAIGNAADMREMADVLAKIDGSLAGVYARRTGQTTAAIAALMDAETWLTADEAVEGGFADATGEPADGDADASARWDLSIYAHVPEALRGSILASTGPEAAPRRQPVSNMKGKSMPEIKTAAEWAAEHPEAAAALRAEVEKEARAAGVEAGREEGRAEGMKAERERIAGLEEVAIPGYEDLLAEAKADGKSTSADLAVKQSLRAKKQGFNALATAQAETGQLGAIQSGAGAEGAAGGSDGDDSERPIEERAKARWENSRDLRAEFKNDFKRYLAYLSATEEGRVKRYQSAPRAA